MVLLPSKCMCEVFPSLCMPSFVDIHLACSERCACLRLSTLSMASTITEIVHALRHGFVLSSTKVPKLNLWSPASPPLGTSNFGGLHY